MTDLAMQQQIGWCCCKLTGLHNHALVADGEQPAQHAGVNANSIFGLEGRFDFIAAPVQTTPK